MTQLSGCEMSAAVESLLGGGGREKRLRLDVLLYEYDSVRCLACVFVCARFSEGG